MAQNDWIVANINNPNLDTYDLVTLGDMDTSNTQLLKEEDYLKSNFIKNNEAFKDENGKFSPEKFDAFYKQQAVKWGEFQQDTFPKGLELDYFDTRRVKNPDARVKDINFRLETEYDPEHGRFGNPDQVKIGIEGWNKVSERTKSEAEIAQSQKIYDPSIGKFLDETPEDSALFSNPLKFLKSFFAEDPLALAVYETDTLDEYGYIHHRGEKKLNGQGTYYYEKLNGRSPMNREILSLGDILTKEDSYLNKIDFMDSDDLDKSVAGVVAKNVATIAPIFIPGFGSYYYKALVAKEMSRALPMLFSVGTNLFSSKAVNAPKWMNTLAAKGESLTLGSSVYSSQHPFSFENFANLMSDVALQWGQQKQVAKAVQYFGGSKSKLAEAEKRAKALFDTKSNGKLAGMAEIAPEAEMIYGKDAWKTTTLGKLCLEKAYKPVQKSMEQRARLGANLGLMYMTMISNTDVYADMKDHGLTNKEAAWVTLGSMAGMYTVDRYTHIGEVFYDELTPGSIKEGRKILRKEFADAFDQIYKPGIKQSPSSLWNKAVNVGRKAGNKIGEFWDNVQHHDLGGFGKAIGEGLEEVSEELATDFAKTLYELAGTVGFKTTTDDVGSWDNALDRYAMSFLGGTMGGGLFYGVEKFNNRFNKREDRDLVDLIRDGKANELRNLVVKYRQNGQIGSTELSGLDYVREKDSNNVTWLTTTDKKRSQNYLIAEKVLDKINSLEATIVGNNLNLSDSELFDNMVLSEARYQQYKNVGNVTGYYQEFKTRLDNLIAAESALKAATKTEDGTPGGREVQSDQADRNNPDQNLKERNIQTLTDNVAKAKQEIDDFLSGDTALEYTRKLNFILDPVLNSAFLDLNYGEWMRDHFNFDPDDPSSVDRQKFIDAQKEWLDHVKDVMSSDQVNKGFTAYMMLEKQLINPMMQQVEVAKTYGETLEKLNELYKLNPEQNAYALSISDYLKKHKPYKFDSRLVDENGVEEDEETWKNRHLSETEDQKIAQAKRMQRVDDLNRQLLQGYVDQFDAILAPINYQVDAASARNILQSVKHRISDVIKDSARYGLLDQTTGSLFDFSKYFDIVTQLKDDFSNKDQILKMMTDRYYANVSSEARQIIPNYDKALDSLISVRIDISELRKNKLLNKLDGASEEEIKEGLQKVKELSSSPILSQYIKDNQVSNKDEYNKLIESLKELEKEADRLEDVDESKGTVTEILEKLSPINKDFILTSNPDVATHEELNKLVSQLKQEISDTIAAIIPQSIQHEKKTLTDIFNDFTGNYDLVDVTTTVQDIIKALNDPNSKEYKYLYNQNNDLPKMIHDVLNNVPMSFGKDIYVGILSGEDIFPDTKGNTMQRQVQAISRYLDTTIGMTNRNPIYQLLSKLEVSVHSPIEQILSTVTTNLMPEGESINIPGLLNQIYKAYVKSDTTDAFTLEDSQIKTLKQAKKAIELTQALIYAASTTPDGKNYFGQNKQINDFAAHHKKDLVKEWQPLPELDNKYSALLSQEITKLYREMQLWQSISDFNTMNKLGRLVNTESALNKLRYNALKGIKYKFTAGDDKEYDLMDGIDSLPEFTDEHTSQLNQLFEIEQTIHDNFAKALKESGKSIEELLKDGKFLDALISKIEDVQKQKISTLDQNMREISDYDKAMYVISLLADNPSDYYRSVKSQIESNSKLSEDKQIAPLTVQQNLSRLSEAAHSHIFKAMFKALAKKVKTNRTIAANIVHVDGAAGAGKTEVVLKAIRARFKDEDALIIGPTASQASKLQSSLNESSSYTFDESDSNNIFKLLLGEDWKKIRSEIKTSTLKLKEKIDSVKVKEADRAGESIEERITGEYFDLIYYGNKGDGYGTRVELHTDKLNFNTKDFNQKLIFVDEAAHMNAVQAALLNEYAEKVGGTVYLASDNNQSGFFKYPLENIGPTSLFCIRTAKLTESLRSSNIQMQENGNKIATLLNISESKFNYEDDVAQKEWLDRLPDAISKLNLRVYDEKDDINGYKIGAELNTLIEQLKTIQANKEASGESVSFGFIGDSSSVTYQQLKDAGIKLSEPLTETVEPGKKFMQGQEFDYVIIDNMKNIPDKLAKDYRTIEFLKRFYTLATRGKVASIFLDDLSNLVGNNTKDSQKSIGFNIKSQVSLFRDNYLESLNKLNLRVPVEESEEETVSEEPEEKKESESKAKEEETVSEEKKESESKAKEEETVSEEKKESESDEPKAEVKKDGTVVINTEKLEIPPELSEKTTKETLVKKATDAELEITEILDIDFNEPSSDVTTENGKGEIEANLVMPITSLEEFIKGGDKFKTWRRYDVSQPKTDSNGKTVRRNLQCFINTDVLDSDVYRLTDKKKYQNYLHSIQSYILFGGTNPNFEGMLEGIDWSKAKLQIELRPVDENTDHFGIGADNLNESFITINKKKYVLAVVLRLENVCNPEHSQFDAVFDICLLTDPTKLNLSARQDAIKKGIDKNVKKWQDKLKLSTISESEKITLKNQIEKANEFKNNLSTLASRYKDAIQKIITNNPNGKIFDLPVDKITLHKISRLVKRKAGARRLGTHVDIANVENNVKSKPGSRFKYETNSDSFMDQDSRKVVSDVYIVGKQSDILEGAIDQSVFGKAVVFVTNNTNLKPDELPKKYIEQKLHPDTHTAEVRMVVLNNHGLSFSELIHQRISSELLVDTGKGSKKPFRMDALGVKMFAAMWNWRAALSNFNDKFIEWRKKYGYSDNKLNALVEFETKLYNDHKDDKNWNLYAQLKTNKSFNNGLTGDSNITETELKALMEFNQEYCKDIPIFRLGNDISQDKNGRCYGGFIRPFKIASESKVYTSGKQVNLFAIDYHVINKYLNILDGILNQLTANDSIWSKVSDEKPLKAMNTRLQHSNGEDYKPKEYIGKDDLNRNLSGLIHTQNGNIVLGEVDSDGNFNETIQIGAGSIFSFFPKALISIATKSRKYQAQSDDQKTSGLIRVKTISDDDKQDYFNFDVAELFGENKLNPDDVYDNTLFNLFDLMFHGTTQSLELWKTKKGEKVKRPYLEDAFAKYGFFVDPEIEFDSSHGQEINISPTADNKRYTFIKCSTSPAYFDVDVDVWPGGMAIDSDFLIQNLLGTWTDNVSSTDSTETKSPTKETKTFSSTIQDSEEKEAFLNYVNDQDGASDSKESYDEWKKNNRINDLRKIFNGTTNPNEALLILNEELKSKHIVLQSVSYDNNTVTYTDTDGNSGTLSFDDNQIVVTPNSTNSTSLNMDSVIKFADDETVSPNNFIEQLNQINSEDDVVSNLNNISDFNSYKQYISDNVDTINSIINNSNLDDSIKNKLLDHISAITNICE